MEETSDNIIHFKIRTFAALIIFLVGGTNIVNTVVHNISDNEEKIQYNADAEERRRKHLEERLEYKALIAELKHTIEILNKDLDACNLSKE